MGYNSKIIDCGNKGFSICKTALLFIFLLLLILFTKMAVFEFYRVNSSSMENTLQVNDFLLVDKFTYGAKTPNKVYLPFIKHEIKLHSFKLPRLRTVKPGDVVVFRGNNLLNNHLIVKRCVATGGQTVKIVNKKVSVDGIEVDSLLIRDNYREMIVNNDSVVFPADYIDPSTQPFGGVNRDNFGPLTVPEGKIFVMGDNRDLSSDSRYFGAINLDQVVGRAVMIYYSFNNNPVSNNQKINWSRLGKFIR